MARPLATWSQADLAPIGSPLGGRFGATDARYDEQLASAAQARLEQYAERVLTAATIAEVLEHRPL